MSQTTLLSSINRTTQYPITVSTTADNHCGMLQLILNSDWTEQMIHELPTINISIYTEDGSKYLSFDINMSTVNEELKNKERSLSPTEPYSIAIYDIPKDITFYVTPLFDKYALKSHNDIINDGNIEIFDTSDRGIVDTDSDNYSSELWTTPTSTFDITIIFDNSNVSSGGSSGGGGSTPTAADISYSGSSSGISATNVQGAIDEVQENINEVNTKVDNLPEPMIFKGSLGTGGTITTLPTASNDNKGFTYKVITAGTYAGQTAEIGDTFISDGTNWILIPSGDEPSGTVTNVAVTSTDGSATITGSPITSSGTINISVNVDNELSDTSTKPVQNKIVTLAINEKLDIEDAVGKNVTGTEYTIDGQTVIAAEGAEIFNNYQGNKATGYRSHAEGSNTLATGNYSHSEGSASHAGGASSHAEGNTAVANGDYSHAEGSWTHATGSGSHAEGGGSQATGVSSHAEGGGTTATGNSSHAEGSGTQATGSSSHAEGAGTQADGDFSHAEGASTIAKSQYQHVQGKYNVEDSVEKYAFIIGNGTSVNDRHNAFAIDWSGNVYVNGSTDGVDVSKYAGKNVTGTQYTIDGQTITASTGAEIFNDYQNNKATGYYSHAEGGGTQATGSNSHAEGGGTKAASYFSHAEGQNTIASGACSHAEGSGTQAINPCSHAEGENTQAIGASSHAEGSRSRAIGAHSHAEGEYTIAAGNNQHVQGKYNVNDQNGTYAFIIGNGTDDSTRHNAFAIDWNGNIYVNGSTTGVNVETLSSILNPISESEYEAITTKDKPLYFIYD